MRELMCNGEFVTMDEDLGEIEAVLTEDGKILAVGEKEELLRAAPDAKMRDMRGNTVLPGFIDGHSHITAVAYQLLIVNLNPPPAGNCGSVKDIIAALQKGLRDRPMPPGRWLLGMGYDNSVFKGGGHPTREDLDQVSQTIPVAAVHVSGHLCVVNSKGMELLGYTSRNFYVPEGGVVEESGLLKEQAFISCSHKMTGPTADEVTEAVGRASKLYASYGITTAQDGKVGPAEYGLLKSAAGRGILVTDVAVYVAFDAAGALAPAKNPRENPYVDGVRIAGVKMFLDGSPQGKTAWLSEPYYVVPKGQKPDYAGFPVMEEDDVTQAMEDCVSNHWQINVHANGDEAIEQMIRCYGKAIKKTGIRQELRPVVIHCQTVREDQLERMGRSGMLASFFLDHVYYWGDYHYESVLGPDRSKRISPLRSALDCGVKFTMHQDSPVVPPNILLSVHNAVNRVTMKGRLLGDEQRITVREALKAVTINGAYQLFEEGRKGSITPGKNADFTVLDKNPLRVRSDEIKTIKVVETIKRGKTIYEA